MLCERCETTAAPSRRSYSKMGTPPKILVGDESDPSSLG